MKSTPNRWIGYVRVSTSEQANEGVSLAQQRQALERWAELSDVELVEIVEDAGVSGTVPVSERPGGQRVFEALESGAATGVVFTKLDRMFRNTIDTLRTVYERFEPAGWGFACLDMALDTSTSAGKLQLTIMAGVAQNWRDQIADRTREAMAQLKRQGVRVGRPPMGWSYSEEEDADGRRVVVPVEREARTIARAKELREQGKTLAVIAETLTAEGHTTKRGGHWHPTSVNRLLPLAG